MPPIKYVATVRDKQQTDHRYEVSRDAKPCRRVWCLVRPVVLLPAPSSHTRTRS
jgi:hypothetical protein